MTAFSHPSCALCLQRAGMSEKEDAAGPSALPTLPESPRPARRRRIRDGRQRSCLGLGLTVVASVAAAMLVPPVSCSAAAQKADAGEGSDVNPRDMDAHSSLSTLIRERETRKRQSSSGQYGPNQNLNFQVNVTPPKTCEPMNITFDPRGGSPPFTIFIGFSQWFPYTVQLPASYADPDVSAWLYQFDVPVFRPYAAPSTPTPLSVVVVSDSTGNLMNSSSFQTVQEGDISCAPVTGNPDFYFYSDPIITACNPMNIGWNYSAPEKGWKDPLNIFLLRELAPPVHIAVTNSSALSYNYTVLLAPGTNIILTMSDEGGTGGVSGQNTVGGSEYIGLQCLAQASSSPLPIAIPTPTVTLSNLRMPDYTALVSSVVTSNGVVSTSTALETYRNGSPLSDSSLGRVGIAGVAIGIALGAAVLAAVLSWYFWRKKNGRRNMLWDVPRSVEGELSKLNASGPIDEHFLRNRSKAMSRTGSAGAPILSPSSDASEERDANQRHRLPLASSDNSITGSHHDGSPLRSQHSPPWISSGSARGYSNLSTGLTHYSDVPSDGYVGGGGGGGVGGIAMARRSSGASSVVSNPFGNAHAVQHGAQRSSRPPFADFRGGNGSEGSESLAMTDARFHSSARLYSDTPAASLYEPDHSYGSRTLPRNAANNPTYVQHSDAGLLMDDSLEEEDVVGGQIELPPQYDAVPRRRAAAAAAATASSSAGRTSDTPSNPATEEWDVAQARSQRRSGGGDSEAEEEEEEEADESQFWTSPSVNRTAGS